MIGTVSFVHAWLITVLFTFSIQSESQKQHVLKSELKLETSPIYFLGRWQTLGPFQIGTRGEAKNKSHETKFDRLV